MFNDAVDELERSTQSELEVDCTAGGTITLTAVQKRFAMFKLIGSPSGAFNLDIPDGDRRIVVWNASGQTVTIDSVTGGTTIVALNDAIAQIVQDGADLKAFAVLDLVADTTPQLGGNLDGKGKTLSDFLFKDAHEVEATPASASGVLVLDIATANAFSVTLTENISTLTLSNPTVSGDLTSITIRWTQDSTPRSITYPSSVKWHAGQGHTLSAGSGAVDVVTMFTVDGGSTWYAFIGGKAMA